MNRKDNSDAESEDAIQRAAPSGSVVYKAILHEADSELKRSSQALFWSGLAAGLSMGFSLVTEGLLRTYLPEARWTPLVSKLGYSVGFIVVILGRQQLFTENTLTPVLPLLLRKDVKTFLNMLRLWGVVLLANLLGSVAFAFAVTKTPAFEPRVHAGFIAIGHEAVRHGFVTVLVKAIFAGWLIALIVWLMPFAEAARLWVIILLTWLVGVARFPHVIAGASVVFSFAAMGQEAWGTVLWRFILPALIGNTIGGVTLVAALNHAQVVAGGTGDDI